MNDFPDSKVHWANMGPTWVLSAPDGPHVGPMNLAIRVVLLQLITWPHSDTLIIGYLFISNHIALWKAATLGKRTSLIGILIENKRKHNNWLIYINQIIDVFLWIIAKQIRHKQHFICPKYLTKLNLKVRSVVLETWKAISNINCRQLAILQRAMVSFHLALLDINHE